tara:strand:- start:8445 stop:9374 length:930 start_codon:yes stop_codon:yes gene_type:complete
MVFGCTGQDGSLISNSLLKKGYEVIGITRSNTPNYQYLKQLGINQSFEIQKIGDENDLFSFQKLIEFHNPIEIYNLSSQSSVGLSFKEPYSSIKSIYHLTLILLEAIRTIQFKGNIFFAGSSEMFGETKVGADINYPREPLSPYAHAKEASFNLVKQYRKYYKINCVTGVLFNHESTLRPDKFVIPKIIKGALQCKKNKNYKLNLGNIDIARDWGWAEDYVEAMQIITRAKKKHDHVICTGKLTSLTELIEKVFKQLDMNWKDHVIIDTKYTRPNDILKSFGSPKALKLELDWENKKSIEDIIDLLLKG